MTQTTERCDSCGMPLADGAEGSQGSAASRYCRHCAPDGALQPYEERFEQMTQWMVRSEGLDRATAEARTRDYLRTMPAWRDH